MIRKIEMFEMMCLGSTCGIRRVDRIRNSLIRERWRCELSVEKCVEMVMSCGKGGGVKIG